MYPSIFYRDIITCTSVFAFNCMYLHVHVSCFFYFSSLSVYGERNVNSLILMNQCIRSGGGAELQWKYTTHGNKLVYLMFSNYGWRGALLLHAYITYSYSRTVSTCKSKCLTAYAVEWYLSLYVMKMHWSSEPLLHIEVLHVHVSGYDCMFRTNKTHFVQAKAVHRERRRYYWSIECIIFV